MNPLNSSPTFCSLLRILSLSTILTLPTLSSRALDANYDESKIPAYELPPLLISESGEKIKTVEAWEKTRRPEILDLFRSQMYGKNPGRLAYMKFVTTESTTSALNGKSLRKQISVRFDGTEEGPQMEILLYLPASAKGPVPVFVGLNFGGNHTIHSDPAIHISKSWMRNRKDSGVIDHKATEAARGKSAGRWAVNEINQRGYGLATIYYGDIDPDFEDGFKNGVHAMFYRNEQKGPKSDEWGSIATWAWGLSRAMDYFETDASIDHRRVAVMGHSRLGKTSLWAGAEDSRFALVISNDSGCGGAALNRRAIGETVHRINTSFPHWFCDNFIQYNNKENSIPFDQHQLIALMAPRPVYVASAEQDRWADPKGEFLSAKHASPVYRLYGKKGMGQEEMPQVNQPIHNQIGYHIRSGKHNVTDFDWTQYLNFADQHLR
ncbi:MAG TPA: acetylxylan esterase [Verrucomicrobiales bacterium]|nr:acetylxylan esterase [Verrucomicrobiales bacterium]